jgi:hypothetical protein
MVPDHGRGTFDQGGMVRTIPQSDGKNLGLSPECPVDRLKFSGRCAVDLRML